MISFACFENQIRCRVLNFLWSLGKGKWASRHKKITLVECIFALNCLWSACFTQIHATPRCAVDLFAGRK